MSPVRAVLLALLIVRAACIAAETIPTPGAPDPRIRSAAYRADEVYRLIGHVGFEIELVLQEGEIFTGHAGGDLDALVIAAHAHHVLIKPKTTVVHTDLVIFTDRRDYHFDYSATARRADATPDTLTYVLRFTYPTPAMGQVPAESERIDELLKRGSGRSANLDYWYCGHPSLQPVSASDDGIHTRLRFASRREWPTVFVRNDEGSESLLNFSVLEGEMIIHRVARQLVLRRGRLTGCIVNKGFGGVGERLDSGTVAPEVERHTKRLLR